MSRIAKAAVLTIAAAAAMVGTAGGASAHDHHQYRHDGAWATGAAIGSPGVLSGNLVQIPIDVPVNVCGNSIDVIGLLNPAFGNTCVND
ncbi:chaplin [Streptomyces sp. NPDC057654]|uniref:chaplin n=1 Tax=Streptomyces sp. NPDC057654 TaxID=3346196 RepID=UPI0036888583